MNTGQWSEPNIDGIDAKPITEIVKKEVVVTSIEFRYHDTYRQYVVVTTNQGKYYSTNPHLVNAFAIDAAKLKKKGYIKGYVDYTKDWRMTFVSKWWE
jgi:hypothetical protein